MSLFSDIAKAQASGGGNYINPGKYLLEVKNVKSKMTGFKGQTYIVELIVRESAVLKEGVAPNPAGAIVSCVWNLSETGVAGKREIMLGHVKAFVLAVCNEAEGMVTQAQIENTAEEITNEDPNLEIVDTDGTKYKPGVQPARGRLVRAVTKDVDTKSGKHFSVPVFSGVTQTPEEVVARRLGQAA